MFVFLYLKLLFEEKISTYIPWLTKVLPMLSLLTRFLVQTYNYFNFNNKN